MGGSLLTNAKWLSKPHIRRGIIRECRTSCGWCSKLPGGLENVAAAAVRGAVCVVVVAVITRRTVGPVRRNPVHVVSCFDPAGWFSGNISGYTRAAWRAVVPWKPVLLVVDNPIDNPSLKRPRDDAASLVIVLTQGKPLLCPGSDPGRLNVDWQRQGLSFGR